MGSGFAPMGADAEPFFSFTGLSKSNSFIFTHIALHA
jgi:hypothetical protein